MEQINLGQGKGGQGTSVTACAVALRAAGEGPAVRLDGRDRGMLAAILGAYGEGPVIPGLVLGESVEPATSWCTTVRRRTARRCS